MYLLLCFFFIYKDKHCILLQTCRSVVCKVYVVHRIKSIITIIKYEKKTTNLLLIHIFVCVCLYVWVYDMWKKNVQFEKKNVMFSPSIPKYTNKYRYRCWIKLYSGKMTSTMYDVLIRHFGLLFGIICAKLMQYTIC